MQPRRCLVSVLALYFLGAASLSCGARDEPPRPDAAPTTAPELPAEAPTPSAAASERATAPDGPAHGTGGHARPPLPTPEEIAELPPDGGPGFNRLVFESSPYLLQHAANPVDWYPWGEEAFERARAEDKPIFLSVGYSTCHWCHVMERESFEDEEVARLMNDAFVCVKVDREERPDLDHVYMQVTQSMTGGGGWPMTVVMTPEREPFFAGTYFPKEGRFNRMGMLELVPALVDAWENRRDEVLTSAAEIVEFMHKASEGAPSKDLPPSTTSLGLSQLEQRFDPLWGGFGRAPKFPVPHNLLFLLQMHQRTGKEKALEMVLLTLEKMRMGGVFDQIGFGFHRYSTDREWLVPHFEKMLYDQALLVMAYAAAWQVTGDDTHRRTAEEVLAYVLRDMTSPEGGFYSAEDADSEGEEGLFYLWTPGQVREILDESEAELALRAWNIVRGGNFQEQATRRKNGLSIPHLTQPLSELARELDLSTEELDERLERARQELFRVREERIHPLKDDKILTDWNGLMIAAAARAGAAFDEPRYVAAASAAADFVLEHMRRADGRLSKRYRNGVAGMEGVLDDYAFMIWGLLELYGATFEPRWLEEALALDRVQRKHFRDTEQGGFFIAADDVQDLLVRGKEIYDGALPSGNSVAAWNLLRLARLTGRTELEEEAARTIRAFSRTVSRNPSAHSMLMLAVDLAMDSSFEVVVVGEAGAEDTRAMLRAFQARYLPHVVLVQRPPGEAPPITELVPYALDQRSIDGKATAYVCRDFACRAPTTDLEAALQALESGGSGELGED